MSNSREIFEANNLLVLGNLARREGDPEEAHGLLAECLHLWKRTGPAHDLAYDLEAFDRLASAEGVAWRAIGLYSGVKALRQAVRKARSRKTGPSMRQPSSPPAPP